MSENTVSPEAMAALLLAEERAAFEQRVADLEAKLRESEAGAATLRAALLAPGITWTESEDGPGGDCHGCADTRGPGGEHPPCEPGCSCPVRAALASHAGRDFLERLERAEAAGTKALRDLGDCVADLERVERERDMYLRFSEDVKAALRQPGVTGSYVEWAAECRAALDRVEAVEAERDEASAALERACWVREAAEKLIVHEDAAKRIRECSCETIPACEWCQADIAETSCAPGECHPLAALRAALKESPPERPGAPCAHVHAPEREAAPVYPLDDYQGPFCSAEHPEDGPVCGLRPGHDGEHVAGYGGPTWESSSTDAGAEAEHYVEERGIAQSPWGPATQVQIGRYDGRPMAWAEVWGAFSASYPGRWAVEVYPPREHLVDDVSAYHLWVLPAGADVRPLRIDNVAAPESGNGLARRLESAERALRQERAANASLLDAAQRIVRHQYHEGECNPPCKVDGLLRQALEQRAVTSEDDAYDLARDADELKRIAERLIQIELRRVFGYTAEREPGRNQETSPPNVAGNERDADGAGASEPRVEDGRGLRLGASSNDSAEREPGRASSPAPSVSDLLAEAEQAVRYLRGDCGAEVQAAWEAPCFIARLAAALRRERERAERAEGLLGEAEAALDGAWRAHIASVTKPGCGIHLCVSGPRCEEALAIRSLIRRIRAAREGR